MTELFHLHRHDKNQSGQFTAGTKFQTFEGLNRFWQVFATQSNYIVFDDNIKRWPVEYSRTSASSKQIHPIGLEYLANSLKEAGMFLRELIFEEVRKERFPDKPSRRSCIWLMEEQSVSFWRHFLDDRTSAYDLIKVKCDGKIHKGNQSFLDNEIVSFNEFAGSAEHYWKGDLTEGTMNNEMLFFGEIEVLEVKRSF